jgi:polyhydroxyalkanoate synthase
VHVIGWSLGGIFATLAAAASPSLPIASLTVVGTPFDVTKVPMVAPLRPILRPTDSGLATQLYRLLAAVPIPLVGRALQLSSATEMVTKPLATLQNLDDSDWLAQIEAVDRFTDKMHAYPGRSFGQLYHRMLESHQLLTGKVTLSGTEIDVADITAPVLIFAGNTDGIAPINAVQALVPLLSRAAEVRFEIGSGGHLGVLTGRGARTTTWVTMDEWIEQYSRPDDRPAHRRAGRKKTGPRASTKKVVTTASAAAPGGPATAQEPAGTLGSDRPVIGSNPEGRFDSASPRDLTPGS